MTISKPAISPVFVFALPPKADMCSALAYVCFGPEADIQDRKCHVRLGPEQTLIGDAYRSSSTPRIIGTHVPPIWVAITLPALLSALAMSRLGRPISMP
jgi:hypothetical protein